MDRASGECVWNTGTRTQAVFVERFRAFSSPPTFTTVTLPYDGVGCVLCAERKVGFLSTTISIAVAFFWASLFCFRLIFVDVFVVTSAPRTVAVLLLLIFFLFLSCFVVYRCWIFCLCLAAFSGLRAGESADGSVMFTLFLVDRPPGVAAICIMIRRSCPCYTVFVFCSVL